MKYLVVLIVFQFSILSNTNLQAQWVQTNGPAFANVQSLTANGTNIFAGTPSGVFLSTNNGTNWTQVNNDLPGNYYAWSLAVSKTNIFAGTTDGGGGGGVFRSTNNGSSWIEVNNGLTNDHVWTLSASGTNLFAGTYSSGAFLSTNNGTNWIKIGLNTYVLDFAVCETNIFAAAFGGVYRRPLSELVSVSKEVNVLSQDYTLYQNYPNPWNPSTNIKYSIPKTSQVSIKVYDIIGNEIKTLVNEDKPAGAYELTWNAGNLPSGIYFYRLQAGSFIETKKMILLK